MRELEHVQALRCPVHRGRQPGGTRPDDDEVTDDVPAPAVEAQALRDFLDRRLLQHLLAAADEDGNIVHPHAEALEHRLHGRIAVGVKIRIRLVVARQELLQCQSARRVPGSNEHDVSGASRHEQCAPEDEGPQKDLAQLRVRYDQAAHSLRGHLEDAAR